MLTMFKKLNLVNFQTSGKTNVFNQATAATEDNPLATPYLAPDLTRTDYNARIARRQYLRQYKDDRAQVKRMQRMFEDSMGELNNI